jgi:hypothetical protein
MNIRTTIPRWVWITMAWLNVVTAISTFVFLHQLADALFFTAMALWFAWMVPARKSV